MSQFAAFKVETATTILLAGVKKEIKPFGDHLGAAMIVGQSKLSFPGFWVITIRFTDWLKGLVSAYP